MITQEFIRDILTYNPQNGVFTWRKNRGPLRAGARAGSDNGHGYLQIKINGRLYMAHRLAFLYMVGRMPKEEVDHMDGLRDNNKWRNLREVSRIENMKNQCLYRNNTSGICGVSYENGLWRSYVSVEGKIIYLGKHKILEDAVSARNNANVRYKFTLRHGAAA